MFPIVMSSVLAKVTFEYDYSPYDWDLLVFIVLMGAVLFLLAQTGVGHIPISFRSPTGRKSRTRPDSLDMPLPPSAEELPPPRSAAVHAGGRQKPSDRRRSLRRGGNPVDVQVKDTSNPGDACPGLVVNRSRNGLRLCVEQPIMAGAVLQVKVAQPNEDLPWVGIRVRHSRRQGKRWVLGCEFTEVLPWSVLLLFG